LDGLYFHIIHLLHDLTIHNAMHVTFPDKLMIYAAAAFSLRPHHKGYMASHEDTDLIAHFRPSGHESHVPLACGADSSSSRRRLKGDLHLPIYAAWAAGF
jgi:hypothetical protein